MKIILISDTHEQHEQVIVPPCDVLVHAGDLTYRGKYGATKKALQWLERQPAKHVIFIAGNHDFLFENSPNDAADLLIQIAPRVHYLQETGIEIDGLKFWGSPWTPAFNNWAFNGDPAEMFKYWNKIPLDTNVLITHGPPKGLLDQSNPKHHTENLGCYDLRETISRIKPQIHVFGHIHGGYGTVATVGTDWVTKPVFYNASVVNESYDVVNKPWEVTL